MNDPNVFKEVRCAVCKKRVATRLCDFVVGYSQPTFFRTYREFKRQSLHETCDLPLCDECAEEYNGIYDFCPDHKELFEKIKMSNRKS